MRYYYLNGKDQIGPLSKDEIRALNLSPNTLVFREDFDKWHKLEEVSELNRTLESTDSNIPKPNPNAIKISDKLKVKKQRLNRLIYWLSFNLFALVMSYSGIGLFNNSGYQSTEAFWPFVEYVNYNKYFDPSADGRTPNLHTGEFEQGKWVEKVKFDGLFVDYDWTEFLVYSGIGLLIFFFIKNPETTT